ncbi:AAA domain-containing protein [Cryptosporangium arvum]|uniref:AAA domain-containing protein n=1 Tax=Cryptosporangium arvum DSM 44712 TaxID=927661 RepID=A0A010ZXR9_9ACTN|nr:AAA domain-containing protein [Cryptosporangium arvum]EXG82017.1 hypothetical protein CryarDRAFT_3149 [Cryptosporangium arvum DSM 44712]
MDDGVLERAIEQKIGEWEQQLIDLSYKNNLLYFRQNGTSTLNLAEASAAAIERLLAGQVVRLSTLYPDLDTRSEVRTRVRSLAKKIRTIDEEQGINAGYIALGMASWRFADSLGVTKQPHAPVLLCPLRITPRSPTQEDFDLELRGPIEPNLVLAYFLRRQHGVELDESTLLGPDGTDAYGKLAEVQATLETAAGRLTDFRVDDALVLGFFSYEKLPIVRDLRASASVLAGHPVIAAIAGLPGAREALAAAPTGTARPGPDAITPSAEHLVLDADASQSRAIDAVLGGRHVIIKGPPGTGKSQTIANLIAALAAERKTVLFVAEKRAAIDAVVDRLNKVGLADLVFDLHSGAGDRKSVIAQVRESMERIGQAEQRQVGELHTRLSRDRSDLLAYRRTMHEPVMPWGLSPFDAQSELLGIPSALRTGVTMPLRAVRNLGGSAFDAVSEDLRRYLELDGLRITPDTTPWADASVNTAAEVEQLRQVLDDLVGSTLPDARRSLQNALDQTGLPRPASLSAWRVTLDLLERVQRTVQVFGPEVFGLPLEQLADASGSRRWRRGRSDQPGWRTRRRLVRELRDRRRDGQRKRAVLHRDLLLAISEREDWQTLSPTGAGPVSVAGLEEVLDHFNAAQRELTLVGAVLVTTRFDDLGDADAEQTVRRLHEDQQTLVNLPQLNEARRRLEAAGLGPVLAALQPLGVSVDEGVTRLRAAWLTGILAEMRAGVAAYRTFKAPVHDAASERFRTADRDHLREAAARVRYRVAEHLNNARNDYPAEKALVQKESRKVRNHPPLRKMLDGAPNLMLAARPCWAMSPLVVSQVLPPQRLFDVVIFDEASQVRPADAITSIMRGDRLVVAGDERQLPPTNFFELALATGGPNEEIDDDGVTLTDFQSILEVLDTGLLDQHGLTWHYRSTDERLIAFSNEHIYDRALTTFPGISAQRPISFHQVDGSAVAGQGGATEEVDAVVELAVDHALTTPTQTLGIITLGEKHADRIESKLRKVLQDRPGLQGFFGRPAEPGGNWQPYFVKPVERVQGDERDVILFAVGYGVRGATGTVNHNFGPLNKDGGERRLNVAISRARRRMTVVATFSSADLDESRLSKPGARLFRRFLHYAEHGEAVLRDGATEPRVLNGFEQDVLDRLSAAGLDPRPQYGVSGATIDFALPHPDQPGRMVLAVEADGATYHSSGSARDRDRLRQEHLERLGWRFHRIWSTQWFRDPEGEVGRVQEAWKAAVLTADAPAETPVTIPTAAAPAERRRTLPRPKFQPGQPISEYPPRDLLRIVKWVKSDGVLRDNEELLRAVMAELGFKRQGPRIKSAIGTAIQAARETR